MESPTAEAVGTSRTPTLQRARPVRDFILAGLRTPVVLALILLTSVVYVLQLSLGPHDAIGLDNPVFRSLATWTPWVQHFQWWRLGTNALLHHSGWHLWGNMWPLYLFGPLVVAVYGTTWFLVAYLVCNAAGVLATIGITHAPGYYDGASIAVYGIHGVVIVIALFRLRQPGMRLYLSAALLSVAGELWPYTWANLQRNQIHLAGIAAGVLLGIGFEGLRTQRLQQWGRFAVSLVVLTIAAAVAAAGWPAPV